MHGLKSIENASGRMQNGYIATLVANKMDGDQQMPWSWGKRKLQSYLPGLDTKVRIWNSNVKFSCLVAWIHCCTRLCDAVKICHAQSAL